MAWYFTPPTFDESNRIVGSMIVKIPTGMSVIKNGSSYTTVQTVTTGAWDTADMVYVGGHTYEVSAAEAALLTAAGYSPVEIA